MSGDAPESRRQAAGHARDAQAVAGDASRHLAQRAGLPAELLLSRAHTLDPRGDLDAPHDVLVRDGQIAELAPPGSLRAPEGVERIDASGLHLLPGFCDPHVHLRTPGQEHKEDLESGTRAAAAGGFVQLIAMPNTAPVVDSAPVLRSLREAAAREAHVPVGFLAAITVGLHGAQLTEMAELADAGALGFTDDGKPVAAAAMLRRALQYQRLVGLPLALHEEDPTLSAQGVMHEGEVSARLGLAGIPSIAESTLIARDASIAGYEDGTIHIQHISAAESVAAVAEAQARGVKITAEAAPHHLCLTDAAILDTLDTSLKMNPPLRTEHDRQAVIGALRDGTIDCIATDHAPHAPHEKEVPWEEAPMGTTGLETAFAAVYTELVEPGVLPLALVVERLTAGCALFGLPVPRIAPDAPANLVLVDLEATQRVGTGEAGGRGYESRSSNSCFAGRELRGTIELTLAGGQLVHRARKQATLDGMATEPGSQPEGGCHA